MLIFILRMYAALTNSRDANRSLQRALRERDTKRKRAKRVRDERRRFVARYK